VALPGEGAYQGSVSGSMARLVLRAAMVAFLAGRV